MRQSKTKNRITTLIMSVLGLILILSGGLVNGCTSSKAAVKDERVDMDGEKIELCSEGVRLDISCIIKNKWDNRFEGEIVIENTNNTPIKKWGIGFCFDGCIENVWNARYCSENSKYYFINMDWNETIDANEKVCIGFIASRSGENPWLNNMCLVTQNDYIEIKHKCSDLISEETDNLSRLSEERVEEEEIKASIVVQNKPNGSFDYNVARVVKEVPDLNDGIVACFHDNTKTYESYTKSGDSIINSNPVVSDEIRLSGKEIVILDQMMGNKQVSICGDRIKSEQMTTIYCKDGDVVINAQDANYNGLIYAPKGNVRINCDSLVLEGMIVARGVEINGNRQKFADNAELKEKFEVLRTIDLNLVKDKDDTYGEYYNNIDYEMLAKKMIVSSIDCGKPQDVERITLGIKLDLLDESSRLKAYAYNFEIDGVSGFVIMSAHSYGYLAERIVFGEKLHEDARKIYYLPNNTIIYGHGNSLKDQNNSPVTTEEFKEICNYYSGCKMNISYDYLERIEKDNTITISIINNPMKELILSKHYDGTDDGAYGGAGINNISKYLKSRYGGAPYRSGGEVLAVDNRTMKDIAGNDKKTCSLVAISKVLLFARTNRKKKIPADIKTIYKDVKKIASRDYGYSGSDGLSFLNISDLTKDVLKKYGYKNSVCTGVYIWNFEQPIKEEIMARRPLIFNIAQGYYSNHSVTVAGYYTYKTNGSEYQMLCISDGWAGGCRYIDFDAFGWDFVNGGFGSFNTIKVA